jgi:hypothetical protein
MRSRRGVKVGALLLACSLFALSAAGTVWCKQCQQGCNNGTGPGGSGLQTGASGTGGGGWTEWEKIWHPKNDCNGVGVRCTTTSSSSLCYEERQRACTILGCTSWSSWLSVNTSDCR